MPEEQRPLTYDELLEGRIKLYQPGQGPRFSMDTVLLASWVRVRPRRGRFVELGSGAGGVALALALRFPPPFTITGVEIQRELLALSQQNLILNEMQGRVTFLHGDLRDRGLLPREAFDGLVMNPPYSSAKGERSSPVAARSIARHGVLGKEETFSLEDLAEAGMRLLKERGRLFAIFRADRLTPFMSVLARQGLIPKRLKMIHPRPGKPANLFLVECVKGGKGASEDGLVIEPPLAVEGPDGRYTPDLLQAYSLEEKATAALG